MTHYGNPVYEQCSAVLGSCQCLLKKGHVEDRHQTILVSGATLTWQKQPRRKVLLMPTSTAETQGPLRRQTNCEKADKDWVRDER